MSVKDFVQRVVLREEFVADGLKFFTEVCFQI